MDRIKKINYWPAFNELCVEFGKYDYQKMISIKNGCLSFEVEEVTYSTHLDILLYDLCGLMALYEEQIVNAEKE